jgi:chaperonin GroES
MNRLPNERDTPPDYSGIQGMAYTPQPVPPDDDAYLSDFQPDTAEPSGPSPADIIARVNAQISMDNIAEDMDPDELREIGRLVIEECGMDIRSRSKWEERYSDAIKLGKLITEKKNTPWPNASNVAYPLITQACIQFQSRAAGAIIKDGAMVRTRTLGKATPEKNDRATRISEHMSYQLSDEIENWADETDILLMSVPLIGSGFKKTYHDPVSKTHVSEFVPAWDLILSYYTKSFEKCPRITHRYELYPHEIESNIRSGIFRQADYIRYAPESNVRPDIKGADAPAPDPLDTQAPTQFYEQHRWLDLDKDGMEEPYIVTVHVQTQEVARIVTGYEAGGVILDPEDPEKIIRFEQEKCFTRYILLPDPEGGIYGMGMGMYLGGVNNSINTMLNQLIDAGTKENSGGGFAGMNIDLGKTSDGGAIRTRPGEWRRVSASGTDLRNNLVPYPSTPPSTVLFQLLGFMVAAGEKLGSVTDVLSGETPPANVPATTTMAMIEQGLKVFTAIYKRIYRSLRAEFKRIYHLNSLYLDDNVYFIFQDEDRAIARADYAEGDMDVVPVADPQEVSDSLRILRAASLIEMLGKGFNDAEIRRRYVLAIGIDDVETLLDNSRQGEDPATAVERMKAENDRAKIDADRERIAIDREKIAIERERLEIDRKESEARKVNLLSAAELNTAKADATGQEAMRAEFMVHLDALLKVMGIDLQQQGIDVQKVAGADAMQIKREDREHEIGMTSMNQDHQSNMQREAMNAESERRVGGVAGSPDNQGVSDKAGRGSGERVAGNGQGIQPELPLG